MPEVPALPGLAGLTAHVFRAGGALSQALPDYEPRAGQAEMASRVADVFGGVIEVCHAVKFSKEAMDSFEGSAHRKIVGGKLSECFGDVPV